MRRCERKGKPENFVFGVEEEEEEEEDDDEDEVEEEEDEEVEEVEEEEFVKSNTLDGWGWAGWNLHSQVQMLLPLAVAMQDGSAGELVLQDRECEKIDEPPVRYIVDKMPISNVIFLEYLLIILYILILT